jgi:hypothetical protein
VKGGAARTVASKAPRKNLGGAGGSSAAASRAISAAGACSSPGGKYTTPTNSYNPQPVPAWQKPLTAFFKTDQNIFPLKDEEEDVIEEAKAPKAKEKGKVKGEVKSPEKKDEKAKEEDEVNEPAVKKVKVKKAVDEKDDEKEEEVGESNNEGGNLSKSDSTKLQKNGVISDSDED